MLGCRILYCGLYVNELVLKLTERRDPHSELFLDYAMCLSGLLDAGQDNSRLEPVLRRFEVQLLNELGLGMLLSEDQQGNAIDPGAHYRYDIHGGAVPARSGASTVSGACLLALAQGEFDTQQQRVEARQLMRRVLAQHLGGRELKSRELFRSTRTAG